MSANKILLIGFFPLLLMSSYKETQGQILKTDRPVNPSDTTTGWKGSLITSFDLHNRSGYVGQENIYRVLNLAFDLDYLTSKHEFIAINQFFYKSATNARALSTGYIHLRGRFFRAKRVSPEIFTQFQYDIGRHLLFRQLEGGGLRFNIWLNDKVDVHAGLGAMFEYEEWREQDMSIESIGLAKMSSYLVLEYQILENLRVNLINYYQTGFDANIDSYRNRISGDAILKLRINSRFSFTNQFIYQWENRPVINIENFVFQYLTGLSINF